MSTMRKIIIGLLVIAVVGIAAWLAVRPDTDRASTKPQVATSFYPLYDFARQIGGDKIDLINVTPPGTEPHDYDPPVKELARIQHADVFVYNGGLEPWAEGFLRDYRGIAVKTSDNIELLEGSDPHFWLDPVLAQGIVDKIRDSLIKADPSNKTYYEQRATSYNQKLAELDVAFKKGLVVCDQNAIVSSHDAFSYVAKRYGFEVIAVAGISPEEEPSPARLAEVSRLVKEKNIHYILFETLVSPRLADTIASETGASTLVLDPLEGLSDEDKEQGKDYLSIQRENLETLRRALACH